MKPSRRELLIGAALAPLAYRAGAQERPRGSGGAGAPLPATGSQWRVPDEVLLFDGSTLRPVHDRNKILVLYWWASWCPFCALQSPMLDKLWRTHRNAGLQMLALAVDKKREDALVYYRAKGYAFASTWVTPEIERVMPRPKGLPATVVLGRDGKVLMALPGQSFPEDIEEIARFL